jgi:hypothetical protein
MNAFTAVKDLLSSRFPKLEPKQPSEPEPAYGKPRPMTGFLATLTEDQQKAALSFKGPDLLGDPKKV